MSEITRFEHLVIAALSNPNLCTGKAPDWQLKAWFGGRMGLTSEEIATRQAAEYAKDAEKFLNKL